MKLRLFLSLLLGGTMTLLSGGCASKASSDAATSERMLVASGFKVIPATTPPQLQHLATLAPGQLTVVNRKGKDFYVYPDAARKVVLVGTPAQYQAFLTRVSIAQNAAADNHVMQTSLTESRTDDTELWNNAWGDWTGD